jgi:primosomal protein N'
MLHTALAVGSVANKNFLIQTRDIENPVTSALMAGDLKAFYKSEIARRETFGYPPFMTIVKLIHTSRKDDFENIGNFAKNALAEYSPNIRRRKLGKLFVTSIVLKLPKSSWDSGTLIKDISIERNLHQTLSSLGPDWQIRINPENLF